MPTEESWMGERIVITRWIEPLTADDLVRCFSSLTEMIRSKPHLVHLVFDLRDAGSIPARAPIIAIKSGMFSAENTGNIAVASLDSMAELLASVAARRMRHPIFFFKTYEDALAFIAWESGSPNE
jgi:hypothetical protein